MTELLIIVSVLILFAYLWYGFKLYTQIWWAWGKQSKLKSLLTLLMVVLFWPAVFLWAIVK